MEELSKAAQSAEKSQKNESLIQFVKFLFVGAFNAGVSYFTYAVVIALGGHYILGNTLGFILSVFSSFLINGNLVFKKKDGEQRVWWKVLLKLYLTYAITGLVLANLLSALMLEVIDISRFLHFPAELMTANGFAISPEKLATYVAPIINMFFGTPINFVINKFWAYRTKKAPNNM